MRKWLEPDRFYAVKGFGRIVLVTGMALYGAGMLLDSGRIKQGGQLTMLAAITIYGYGLLLKRARAERRDA